MSQINKVRIFLILIVFTVFVFAGCNPTKLPFIKEKILEMDKQKTKEAEEIVQKSPTLKNLDILCTDLPHIGEFEVLSKSFNQGNQPKLFYYYFANMNLENLKNDDEKHLLERGFSLEKKEDGRFIDKIIFKKQNHQITIFYGGEQEKQEYSTVCELLATE